MPRRDFVRSLPVLAVGAVLPLTAGCAGAPYLLPTARPGGLVIRAAEVGEGAFVQSGTMERPIWISPSEDGDMVAVLAACTHQGCQPSPVAGRLVCPCHGSEFTMAGEVLQGPAERPLTRYPVARDGDELVIRVGGAGS